MALAPLFPGYEITRQLGQGSSSTVWLGTRLKDRALFAVKCPHREAQALDLGNATREVVLLSHLQHQHIVRVHEVLEATGPAATIGIVMDYAAGGSLANLLVGRERLSIGETVTALTPIAQAVAYLHSNGVVHGDVSPGNVLFTAVGMPLLADLGLAARVGDSEQNAEVGTPGFSDPFSAAAALARSDGELRPQRDVYSLAAIGWYCLTGVVPEPPQLRPPLSLLVPDVPKSMAAALEAALDPDPLARPSAKEFGTAIFRSAAPEALDLSGAVHRSVIPQLLTRREAHGRKPRRATPWLRLRRRFLPLPQHRAQTGIPPQWHSRRALVRWWALVVVGGALLAGLAWNLWQPGTPGESRSAAEQAVSGSASPAPSMEPVRADDLPDGMGAALRAEDPAVAVAALSALRDVALREGRLELLDLVNAQGSPAAESDQKLREQLQESGTTFAGFTTRLSGVVVGPSPEADLARVDLIATTSSFEERNAAGAVVRTQPAGTAKALSLTLVRSDGRWWLSEINGPAN